MVRAHTQMMNDDGSNLDARTTRATHTRKRRFKFCFREEEKQHTSRLDSDYGHIRSY